MKVNLGCGKNIREDYINLDIRFSPTIDIVADVCALPFKDESLDEILSLDIYEHISHQKSQELLCHWVSKLRNKGLLFIQAPSIDRIVEYFLGSNNSLEMIETTIACIFGGQDYPRNFHCTICHPVLMDHYLKQAGIKGNIEFQLDGTNIRFRAYK